MKVKALKNFEGIKDLERDIFPKAGDEWECTAERAELLLNHGVVEIVEETKEKAVGTIDYNVPEDAELKVEMRLEEKPKKKKTSKK